MYTQRTIQASALAQRPHMFSKVCLIQAQQRRMVILAATII